MEIPELPDEIQELLKYEGKGMVDSVVNMVVLFIEIFGASTNKREFSIVAPLILAKMCTCVLTISRAHGIDVEKEVREYFSFITGEEETDRRRRALYKLILDNEYEDYKQLETQETPIEDIIRQRLQDGFDKDKGDDESGD